MPNSNVNTTTPMDDYRRLLEQYQARKREDDMRRRLNMYQAGGDHLGNYDETSPIPAVYPKPDVTTFANDYKFASAKSKRADNQDVMDEYLATGNLPYKNKAESALAFQNEVMREITPKKGIPRKKGDK